MGKVKKALIYKTDPRKQIGNLNILPIIDRSLIDYEKYLEFIGHTGAKHAMAVQATRGCPYRCFYCDVVQTAPTHYRRSVENIFNEIKILADIGVKRIDFIDDIFNVNKKHFTEFFEVVLKEGLDLKFFFSSGLKGDLLTKDMIDLMVEAGTIGVNLSLEHAAPRMQKLMRKGLDVEALRENLHYFTEKYPQVVLGLNCMHGFPSETEEEAMLTLNYMKSIKWLHFPYLVSVRIFPGTEIEKIALAQGIPQELIEQSQSLAYEEVSETLAFSQDFTKYVKMSFLRDYVLNKERLLHILPYQMEVFCEDELNQKYNSYFPSKINSFDDLLKYAKIDRSELRITECLDENLIRIPEVNTRIKDHYPPVAKKSKDALRLMLVDVTMNFADKHEAQERVLFEAPMGLMALMSYINEQKFAEQIEGKIYKAQMDFNSWEELYNLVNDFKPDLIGFRVMTYYKKLLFQASAYLRKRGVTVPIIAGGPHATSSYREILENKNINIAVISEGEITLAEILKQTLANNKRLPDAEVLKKIPGITFWDETECTLVNGETEKAYADLMTEAEEDSKKAREEAEKQIHIESDAEAIVA